MFQRVAIQPYFPQPLTALRNAKCLKLNYHELLQVCKDVSIDITSEMCDLLEKETRSQSKSKYGTSTRLGELLLPR